MKDQEIFFSNQLKIAVFDFDTGFDRSGLLACGSRYPSVEVLGETEVHRSLRAAGAQPDVLVGWGDDFASFTRLKGFHLLLIAFREEQTPYLRIVNYLGHYVRTVVLDLKVPTCEDILRAQRVAVIDSHPPYADVKIDGRVVGEAPVWVWLRDGAYEVECVLPGETFKPKALMVPKQVGLQCMRENSSADARESEDEKMTGEQKAGSVLIFLVGAAATAAAIVLPILFLF